MLVIFAVRYVDSVFTEVNIILGNSLFYVYDCTRLWDYYTMIVYSNLHYLQSKYA